MATAQNKTVIGYPVAAATTSAAVNCCYDYESEEEDDDDDEDIDCSSLRPIDILRIIMSDMAPFLVLGMVIFLFVMGNCDFDSEMPDFLVDSASFSQLNSTASRLTASWVVSLRVKNPNSDMSRSYDVFHASVLYGGQSEPPLDVTRVTPFHQERLGESIVNLQFGVVSEYVGEAVVEGVTSDAWARGFVEFRVLVQTLVVGSGSFEEDLQVLCDSLKFGLSSRNGTATFMGPSRKCLVERL